jgi:hypothetical protein
MPRRAPNHRHGGWPRVSRDWRVYPV